MTGTWTGEKDDGVCVRAMLQLSNLDTMKSITPSKTCLASINEHPRQIRLM